MCPIKVGTLTFQPLCGPGRLGNWAVARAHSRWQMHISQPAENLHLKCAYFILFYVLSILGPFT